MAGKGWSADGADFPSLEIHTKKKHDILKDYLRDWVVTLCAHHRGNAKTVTIVDAFCGGGIYHDPETKSRWYGSPIRIIQAIEEGLEIVRTEKSKPNFQLDWKVVFIDSKREQRQVLKNICLISIVARSSAGNLEKSWTICCSQSSKGKDIHSFSWTLSGIPNILWITYEKLWALEDQKCFSLT